MADILGRQEQVFAGGLTSDASWMFWAGMPNGGLGLLVTQMGISYQQPIRRIYEIGPWTSVGGSSGQPVYYVAGRPEGMLQISTIVGPLAATSGFYKTYGNICSYINSLFFVSSTGCLGGLGAGAQVGNTFGGQGAKLPTIGASVPTTVQGGKQNPYLGWYMNGVAITSLGITAQAQDMLLIQSVQMMFISLRLFTAAPASIKVGAAGGNATITGGWTEV